MIPAQIRIQFPGLVLPRVLRDKAPEGSRPFMRPDLEPVKAAKGKAPGDKSWKAAVSSSRKLKPKAGGPHGVSADGVLETVF